MANKKQPIKKTTTKKHMAREHREARQTRIIVIVSIVVGTIILGLVAYGVIDQTVIRPRIAVATVGNETIRVREFDSYVQYSRAQLLNQSFQYYTFYQQFGEFGGNFLQTAQSLATQLTQPISFGRDILDEMIDNLIIREEAAKRGISVSQAEIDEAVQTAFGFFPNGTPTPTVTGTIQPTPTYSETQLAIITLTSTPTATVEESEESADAEPPLTDEIEDAGTDEETIVTDDAVAEPEVDIAEEQGTAEEEVEFTPTPEVTPTITLTPTPYTTALFAQNIKDFNTNYAAFNFDIKQLREIFEIQLLREKLIDELTQDLPRSKNEVWARHILVETNEEALEVLLLLEEGEDFHTLAATYSIDESNREQGGNLGWFDENMMVPEFSEAAFSLAEGEVSEPIQTSFGFHIIQVIGKRVSQVLPAEFAQRQQTAFAEWLAEQRNTRDDIEINPNWDRYVPNTPEVPQQYLAELYQLGQ
ncbi:MAG: peptidylprolyl isomerase [Brevefilum sp.]|nr:peptidylprolyl isomerase [Brevefilum sp.]